MKELFTENEYVKSNSKELLYLQCYRCGKEFQKQKKYITSARKGSIKNKCMYCSKRCSDMSKVKSQKVNCGICNVLFTKQLNQINNTPNHFCSKSCSAINSNRVYQKRLKENICKHCDTFINSGYVYCKACWNKHKAKTKVADKTIFDMIAKEGKPANKYRHIRDHARKIIFNKAFSKYDYKCSVCLYSKMVEVAHIIPISSFPENTPVSIVNAKSNLSLLCRNHHWEFDHNYLRRDEILSWEENLALGLK